MACANFSFTLLVLCSCFATSFIACHGFPVHHNNPFHHRHHPRFASHNYRDALTKSILFFEGQRSGKLPSSQRMTWRRDSGLTDGSTMHVDLVGGYYDAGDNVKFGFPMAFTTTMLSWSVLEFGGLMKGELQNAREAIRWATDYLLKATAHTDTIYVQVGNANKDHACWERPEDMDTPRSVFKVDKHSPGSDVAAETAAALAAASLVFRRCDPTYAKLLVRRAIRVFQFADKYRGAYSNGLKRFVCPFYCSYSGYEDELLWGAAWLHKATKNPTYLNYIQVNGQTLGAAQFDNTFGWDNKHVGARILLSKAFLVQKLQSLHDYKGHADNFICSLIPGAPFSSAQYTPGGLLFKMSDSNMQYVTSTSFLLLTYAKYLTSARTVVNCGGTVVTPKRLRTIAKKQVDYLLGDNPLKMSYMVGYGPRYPQRIHHRGSSLPSIATHPGKIQCTSGFGVMNSQSPNPNVLVGAIVGGPDEHDRFPDERSDHEQSEPATYINAPLVGALAYLAHSSGQLEVHTNIFSVRRWSLRVIDRRKETRKGKEIKREISQAHVILFGGSGSCGQKDLFELQACQMVSGEPMLFFSSAMIDPWPWGQCFIWLQCRTEYHRLIPHRLIPAELSPRPTTGKGQDLEEPNGFACTRLGCLYIQK